MKKNKKFVCAHNFQPSISGFSKNFAAHISAYLRTFKHVNNTNTKPKSNEKCHLVVLVDIPIIFRHCLYADTSPSWTKVLNEQKKQAFALNQSEHYLLSCFVDLLVECRQEIESLKERNEEPPELLCEIHDNVIDAM